MTETQQLIEFAKAIEKKLPKVKRPAFIKFVTEKVPGLTEEFMKEDEKNPQNPEVSGKD